MTYRELLAKLAQLTDEQWEMSVCVAHEGANDKFFMVKDATVSSELGVLHLIVHSHPVLAIF